MKKLALLAGILAIFATSAFAGEYGEWNDDHSAFIVDLNKLNGDAEIAHNDDGSIDVTFKGNYSQFLIPLETGDEEFMKNIKSCVITLSDSTAKKKFALKASKDPKNSYGKPGGLDGQGTNCIAYMFRDYNKQWDADDWTIYFNGDQYSFRRFEKLKNLKALAICNNTTPTPYTMHIESIVWSK